MNSIKAGILLLHQLQACYLQILSTLKELILLIFSTFLKVSLYSSSLIRFMNSNSSRVETEESPTGVSLRIRSTSKSNILLAVRPSLSVDKSKNSLLTFNRQSTSSLICQSEIAKGQRRFSILKSVSPTPGSTDSLMKFITA